MMAAALLAIFVVAILLVSGIYYLVYHPKTLTAEGEAVDLGFTLALVAMIVLVTAALSAMYLLGKLQWP